MQRRNTESHDDTAEHTHLQCLDPANTHDRSAQYILGYRPVGEDLSLYGEHTADRCIHNEKGDHRRQSRNFFLLLRHTYGYSHRKDNGQVVKNNISRAAHDREQGVQYRPVSQYRLQSVSLNRRGIGKGTSDPQQKPCHRKDRDREHKTPSDPLQNTKNLVFHVLSSLNSHFRDGMRPAAHLDSASLHLGRGLAPYTRRPLQALLRTSIPLRFISVAGLRPIQAQQPALESELSSQSPALVQGLKLVRKKSINYSFLSHF